ncbi:uncharacterized [Tachysurus ichikawai]
MWRSPRRRGGAGDARSLPSSPMHFLLPAQHASRVCNQPKPPASFYFPQADRLLQALGTSFCVVPVKEDGQ